MKDFTVFQAVFDTRPDRVVPASGFTFQLTFLTSAAMAFLAVFAMALSLSTARLADRWSSELARTATVRISAPPDQVAAQLAAVLGVLATTPGVETARALEDQEILSLLEPWFGSGLPLDTLPLPRLVAVTEDAAGFDAANLRLRLQAEAPGAVLDDHVRWRRPLVAAAERLRALGLLSIVLIGLATAAMITLAANSALAANGQVIRVLRLVGARDAFIARAFVRRFTLRAVAGAALGTVLGAIAVALLPEQDPQGGFLTGLGFQGWDWLWPLVVAPVAGGVAFAATRVAAFRTLRAMT